MAIYNIPNYKAKNGCGMPLNIRRANPDPLDNSSVWSSYAEALNYAQNDPVAYVGQIITVVTASESSSGSKEHSVEIYKIELDSRGKGTLVKVANNDEVEQLKIDVNAVEELAGSNKIRLDQYDTDKVNYATKEEVTTAKSEAIADAKTETEKQISAVVSQYLTGEGAANTIDTLQEIVDWLNTEGTGADKIIADVETIKNDYLKGSDKTELNQAITNLSNYVGTLPEGATSTTVVAYIQEIIDSLKIGDYAKASDLIILAERVTAVEGKVKTLKETTIPGIETEIDSIDTRVATVEGKAHEHENTDVLTAITSDKITVWDDAAVKKHEHANKSILDAITQDKVDEWNTVISKASNIDLELLKSRVSETETAIAGIPEAVNSKVDKVSSEYNGATVEHRLLNPEEIYKLSKLVLNSDGSFEIGQQVAAGDVVGLAQWLKDNAPTTIENLTKSNLSNELVTQIESAINEITVNGSVLSKTGGKVDIPIATDTTTGVVKVLPNYGLYMHPDGNGNILINKATQEDIKAKKSGYKPIVPQYLDKAVLEGVAYNTIQLTEEEQISAKEWLGINVNDVQVNGTSIVGEGGVAKIPTLKDSSYGLAKVSPYRGMNTYSDGTIAPAEPTNDYINRRNESVLSDVSRSFALTLSKLDYGLKAAMTDGKGEAWTTEEQAAARARMGIPGEYELIETMDISEGVSAIERTLEPNGTPYNFKSLAVLVDAVESNGVTGQLYAQMHYGDGAYDYNNPKISISKGDVALFECKLNGIFAEAHAYNGSQTFFASNRNFLAKTAYTKLVLTSTLISQSTKISILGVRA